MRISMMSRTQRAEGHTGAGGSRRRKKAGVVDAGAEGSVQPGCRRTGLQDQGKVIPSSTGRASQASESGPRFVLSFRAW